MRKKRKGEAVCNCDAYRFPHRFGGGDCDGSGIAVATWNSLFGGGICASCNSFDRKDFICQVVEGMEKPKYGDCVQDFAHRHEVRL